MPPEVDVFAPNLMFAGRTAIVEIVVRTKKETKVDFIDARLKGHQGWRIGSGKNQIVSRAVYPDLVFDVMGEGVLPPGEKRFRAMFELPEGMPPSHDLFPAWAYLELRVHVSIPWWLDGRYRFRLPLRVPPPTQVVRKPFAVRSQATRADQPRIEVSLASTRLIAGETVVGSCAVFHMDDAKPREVVLNLVPSFQLLRYGRIRERRGRELSVNLTIPAGSAGTSIPFRFQLPHDMTPSFATITHVLEWWLVAHTGSFFRGKVDVAVPLEIFDASAVAQSGRLEAPRLSDERIVAAFRRFALENNWTLDEAQLEHDNLRIRYDYRGKHGTFLVASVAHSVGLGLSVTPSSTLRELLSRDIHVEVEWDRTHHVQARCEEQAVPFLRPLVPALVAAEQQLGSFVRFTDDEVAFERPITSVDVDELSAIARALSQLSDAIHRAPIAPPPDLVVDIDAWQRLAKRLDGELTVGDLGIHGTLAQMPVDLGLEFDATGKPISVYAVVGDAQTASEALRTAQVNAEQLPDWPQEFVGLRLHDGVASATVPIAGTADATRAFDLVSALRGVLASLDPAAGPYR